MANLRSWLGDRVDDMRDLLSDLVYSLFGLLAPLMMLGIPFGLLATLAFLVFGPGDDPLFRRPQVPCPHPRPVDSIEITQQGISRQGCVQGEEVTVVNRLPDHPVTLCIGRQGRCLNDHSSPFARNRLTIGPGKSVKNVSFHNDTHYLTTIPQYYPITVIPIPGLRLPNSDLVIKAPISSLSGPFVPT